MDEKLKELKKDLEKDILYRKELMNTESPFQEQNIYKNDVFLAIKYNIADLRLIQEIDTITSKIFDIDFVIRNAQDKADRYYKRRLKELEDDEMGRILGLLHEEFNNRYIVKILTKVKEQANEKIHN